MTLQELLETVIQRGLLTASRIPPMRTSVKQYAAILGMNPTLCPPEMYHLSPPRLTELIDDKAPATLGEHAIRNLKNNLRWLLRQGEVLQLIAPLDHPLMNWRDSRYLGRRWSPQRGERPPSTKTPFALRPLPETLSTEFQEFSDWSTALYVSDRPARLHKRPKTMRIYEEHLEKVAGFAHQVEGIHPDTMTLRTLTEPEFLKRYTTWWIARRGKVTSTAQKPLIYLGVIVKYWLKDEPRAEALHRILAQLPHPEVIQDKHVRWLSLAQLEAAALSRYPMNSRRRREHRHTAQLAKRLAMNKRPTTLSSNRQNTAVWVSYSLMLRLLVRIPLRQRNLREMQLDRNLRRVDGKWQLTFKGDELKIGWRDGRQNQVTYAFPTDLVELLEEWLTVWRPIVLKDAHIKEVFLNRHGRPYPALGLRNAILRTTYKFAGVAVNPHMIRDIWATEYIKSTRDVAGAAYMLGNTVQIVLKHYAHLLDAEAEQRAISWLQSRLM